jgi:hypothetical protein
MKKATAYQREGKVFLHSLSKTTAGVWILSGPVLAQTSIDVSSLGQNVLATLNGSFEQVAHPTSWKGLFDPVLQQVGVKTLSTFMKKCKCVEIESDAGVVSFLPTKNLGSSGGFEPLCAKVGPIALSDASGVGEKLNAAFDLAM